MAERAFLLAVLLAMGAGWGMTQPLAKIAVSTGHGQAGLVFWQSVIVAAILWGVLVLRGQRVPLHKAALWRYVVVALVGTLVPGLTMYAAIRGLPSGFISILLSMVPIFGFPMAIALGTDRFGWARLAGLVLGLGGVVLLLMPGAALPDRAALVLVPLALIAPLLYAFEGNFVARWGTGGASPVQLLAGASVVAVVLSAPLAVLTGQWIAPPLPGALGRAEGALIASAAIHGAVYVTYVWLVGRAGAVFAAQVSYLVTGFGLVWAMLLLGERYAGPVWVALALILCGLALVQPRRTVETTDCARAGGTS